ncbi:MAG: hypothetical protein H0T11_02045 [Chthoniobacterales bacterium]|nr:hypothetical protein [Chthoniobacterales bacterium]
MNRLAIRWRLTLWYGGVLALVLALFSGTVYVVMRQQLLQRIDQGLGEELADVRSEVERAADAQRLHEWLDRRFARHEGFDFQVTKPGGVRFFASQSSPTDIYRLPSKPTANLSLKVCVGLTRSAGGW